MMNQLISNVLMQPKPDATERLTLIEKLEQEIEYCRFKNGYQHRQAAPS